MYRINSGWEISLSLSATVSNNQRLETPFAVLKEIREPPLQDFFPGMNRIICGPMIFFG